MAAILTRLLFLAGLALFPQLAGAGTMQDPLPIVHGGTGLRSCIGPYVGGGTISGACGPLGGQWLAAGAVFGNGPPVNVGSATYPIPGRGWYDVSLAGAALTLPDPSVGGPITISDGTYAPHPHITISGRVNGAPYGLSISSPGGSWTLGAQPATGSWRVLGQTATGVGAVVFSPPPSVSGLALWLDASDASTITASAGAVSAWADKSGAGLVGSGEAGDGEGDHVLQV